ncbi:cupin domain-containing protein [Spirosoma aureum]|uniref:Cupin domain-containing protein n=1 Tax=Spirosoma aureum TaxID=2692134 RepID=A0A6G9AIA4_9BACT|nr:cupin domain-containing protein [Spirosoma aureum]QIP12180.1 cupin domain-containing protein [Spirosoma aureum]
MRFNEQEYLQSDQLEQYCLGLLSPDEAAEVEQLARTYPAIRDELDRLTLLLADYAIDEPVTPSPVLKSRVMMTLSQLGEAPTFDLNNLPLINAFSDADQWQRTVEAIQPPETYRNIFGHVLRQDQEAEQFLVWVRHTINPEDHHDEQESFLILEGRCECSIGGELVQLSAGDYLSVPLDLEHTVRVISETPVKAIIQRLKAV